MNNKYVLILNYGSNLNMVRSFYYNHIVNAAINFDGIKDYFIRLGITFKIKMFYIDGPSVLLEEFSN